VGCPAAAAVGWQRGHLATQQLTLPLVSLPLLLLLLLLPAPTHPTYDTNTAFRSGAVMGFLLAGFGLLNLFLGIIAFKAVSV
jgi:hypothetical protein